MARIDKDDRPDLVVVSGGMNPMEGSVLVLYDPGDDTPPSAWKHTTLDPKDSYARLALGDVDADGDVDIVALTATGYVRWWRSSGGEDPQFEMKEIPLALPACCGSQCQGQGRLFHTSVALSDVDADGDLDLAVSSYVTGRFIPAPLHLLRYDPAASAFVELTEKDGWPGCGRGAMRARFYVDGDGHQNLLTSARQMAPVGTPCRPGGPPPSPDLEWGEWYSLKDLNEGALLSPTKLLYRPSESSLVSCSASPAVVDFDVLRDGAVLRFALAITSHHCPQEDCWKKEGWAGGLVAVVGADGAERWSSRSIEAQAVQGRTDGKTLVPRIVRFVGDASNPELVAGYWWLSKSDDPCTGGRACDGSFLVSDMKDQEHARMRDIGPGLVQAFTPAVFKTTRRAEGRLCAGAAGPHPHLPYAAIVDVGQVCDGGPCDGTRGAFPWVPGGQDVILGGGPPRGDPFCISYRASLDPDFFVGDTARGVRHIVRQDFPP